MLGSLILEDLPENYPYTVPHMDWLFNYRKAGYPHGEPLLLSIGETWEPPPKLIEYLQSQPLHFHSYRFSLYGLPALQRTLKDYIIKTHHLSECDQNSYEVAVGCCGSRSIMFDYGRYLLPEIDTNKIPVIIASAPGFPYWDIFESLGYRFRYLPLTRENSFQPQFSDYKLLLKEIENAFPREQLAMVIINSQHNPTGVNWSANFVRQVILSAISTDTGILIDDAFYALHDPDLVPTSALKILLEEIPEGSLSQKRWLAVRTLGKQFQCHGWGLSACTASPQTLEKFLHQFRFNQQYPIYGFLQGAMKNWLEDEESVKYVKQFNEQLREKRQFVACALREKLLYPKLSYHIGECTPFILMVIPEYYQHLENGVLRYMRDCFSQCGVLFFEATYPNHIGQGNLIRMFLGPDLSQIKDALERMEDKNFAFVAKN